MRPITHAEALELCPALVPDSFSAAGLDTGSFACNASLLLEDHRRRAEAGGVDIITGARVHSAQRLGSGWELGAGQEGFQAAVVVNAAGAWADELAVLSGVEKVQLQPYRRTAAIVDVEHPAPGELPHGGRRRRLASTSGATANRSSSRRRSTNRAGPRTRSRTRATSRR